MFGSIWIFQLMEQLELTFHLAFHQGTNSCHPFSSAFAFYLWCFQWSYIRNVHKQHFLWIGRWISAMRLSALSICVVCLLTGESVSACIKERHPVWVSFITVLQSRVTSRWGCVLSTQQEWTVFMIYMMGYIGLRTLPYSLHKYYKYVQGTMLHPEGHSPTLSQYLNRDSDICDKEMSKELVCKKVLGDGMSLCKVNREQAIWLAIP